MCDASIFRNKKPFLIDTINNVKWMSDWAAKSGHFQNQVLALAKRYKKNTPTKLLLQEVLGIFAYQIYVRNSRARFLKTQSDYRESFFNEILSLWGGVSLGAPF